MGKLLGNRKSRRLLNYRNRAFEEEPGLSMRGDKQRETKDYENGIITNESVGKGENKHTWDSQCL